MKRISIIYIGFLLFSVADIKLFNIIIIFIILIKKKFFILPIIIQIKERRTV